jgi:hypothetical protein
MSDKKKPRRRKREPLPEDGTFAFRCGSGTFTVRIVKRENHIDVKLGNLGIKAVVAKQDSKDFMRWLRRLIEPFDSDRRPLWVESMDAKKRAFIHEIDGQLITFVAEIPT